MISYILLIPVFFLALTIHEFSHGWVAYKLGDTTAKYSGRLTLNPLAHIDPIGTVLFPIVLLILSGGRFTFGWAKPIPINFWNLNNPKKDIIWVGLAGPAANIVLAWVLSLMLKIFPSGPLFELIRFGVIINLFFAVFNLIPVPPLDGSRVVMGLLPTDLANQYASLERYGFVILILLLMLGIIHTLVIPVVAFLAAQMGVPLGF